MNRRQRSAAKRERRKLAEALRATPAPLPPDHLLGQLLGRVPVEPEAPARKPVLRPAWVAGAALAALVAWPASCQLATSLPGYEPPAIAQQTMEPTKQTVDRPIQEAKQPAAGGQAKMAEAPKATEEKGSEPPAKRRHRFARPEVLLASNPAVEDDPPAAAVAQPVMTVSIGHAETSSPGVAKAAAWRRDANGRWVRTVWELSKEKEMMKVVGADGRVQTLTVAPPKAESNGDKS